MSKIFYTVKDGKIDRIQTGKSPAGKADWKEAPANWGGAHGDKFEWFDGNMRRIPDTELVSQGRRKDNRGRWHHKDKIGETIQIHGLDEEPGDDYTREAPLENEPYQTFDRGANKWVVDAERKEEAEEKARLANIQAQIEETERKILPLIIAQNRGRATSEDLGKIDELDNLIEQNLKPELNRVKTSLDNKLEAKKSA